MADFGGGLNIRLSRSGGDTRAQIGAEIRSSRPVGASAVFAGRPLAETAARLPTLYSVCATAQAAACAAACEAALGIAPDPTLATLRRRLVDAETVKEHLWRLLLDWPRFLGGRPDAPAMAAVMQAFGRLKAALSPAGNAFQPGAEAGAADVPAAREALCALAQITGERVLGMAPDAWLAETRTANALLDWAAASDAVAARLLRLVAERGWEGLGASPVPALPRLTPADLEPFLAGPGAQPFVAAPEWSGGARETSPFTRVSDRAPVAELTARFGNGLLPRLAARLLELAELQTALADLEAPCPVEDAPAAATGPGTGIALIPAARGLLVHRVEVAGGLVGGYRILAPTEWNFHPDGAAAQGLSGLRAADEPTLRLQAGLLVTAVDPCVEYDLQLC